MTAAVLALRWCGLASTRRHRRGDGPGRGSRGLPGYRHATGRRTQGRGALALASGPLRRDLEDVVADRAAVEGAHGHPGPHRAPDQHPVELAAVRAAPVDEERPAGAPDDHGGIEPRREVVEPEGEVRAAAAD